MKRSSAIILAVLLFVGTGLYGARLAKAGNLVEDCMGYFLKGKRVGLGAIFFASFFCGAISQDNTTLENKCPVLDGYPQKIDYKNKEKYISPGFQTTAGPNITNAAKWATAYAKNLGGKGLDYFEAVSSTIHERMMFIDYDIKIGKRDAEQIITEGYASGCHDWALVAAAIFRKMGYPVIFVDSVSLSFLNGDSGHSGHALLEVFDKYCDGGKGCWMLYDPTASKQYSQYDPENLLLPGDRVVFAKDVEQWSMGIKSVEELNMCLDIFRDDFYKKGKVPDLKD